MHVFGGEIKVIRIEHDKNFIAFIAIHEKSGETIGWVNLTLQLDNKIKLQDAYVRDGFRGYGVYKALWNERMKYIEENFKGYEVLSYCNDSSVGIFEDNGFTLKETIKKMSKYIK